MDPVWLLLLLPAAAASGWAMAANESRVKKETKPQVPEAFFKGLNLLLNEQPDAALNVFLESENLDEGAVEMHIALGNLFRRRGEIERATQIHQNLIARSDLDESLRCLALFELAQDYLKAGLLDRSEGLFQELRQVVEYKERACRFLLQIYDQEKEWHSAIVIGEELSVISNHDYSEPLAQYCCELAQQAKDANKLGQAEYYLESAFKYDSKCGRAGILAGAVSMIRGNYSGAIENFENMQSWAPEALGEIVPMVSKCYEALGDVQGYKSFLERAVAKNPDARIIEALVDITGRRKGRQAGQQVLVDIVKKYPSLDSFYHLLKQRQSSEWLRLENIDMDLVAQLLYESLGKERGYVCRQCGFSSNSLHWQCPGCKDWGSVQKREFARDWSERQQLGATP